MTKMDSVPRGYVKAADLIKLPSATAAHTELVIEEDAFSEANLVIGGMTCSSCVNSIEKHLLSQPGIKTASVTLSTCKGRFTFDPEVTRIKKIIETIEDMGFDADVAKAGHAINKMNEMQLEEIRKWRRAFLINLAFGVS